MKKKYTKINEFGLPNIIIPAEIIFNDNLTWREKGLFGFINNLTANEYGYCWAANRYLGKCIGVKPETISAMISKLHNEGYLILEYETKYDGAQVRKISINTAYHQTYKNILKEALIKIKRPIKEMLKTPKGKNKKLLSKTLNNIDSNIDSNIDKIVSKDTYVFSKHSDIISSIINFWNNLPNTTIHLNTKTKLYKNISFQIENLLEGIPLIKKIDNTATKPFLDFITTNNIPKNLLNKIWEEIEIKNILQAISDELALDFKEGDKTLSLDQTLWNAFAKKRGGGFSLFLHTAAQINIPEKYTQITDKLISSIKARISPSKKKVWAQILQKFIKDENIPENEINDILNWYAFHKDEKYTPVIDSPQELQEKYSRLKQAIDRSKNKLIQPLQELTETGFPILTKPYGCPTQGTAEAWQKIFERSVNKLLNAQIWDTGFDPDKIKIFNGFIQIQEWLDNIDYDAIRASGAVYRKMGTIDLFCTQLIDFLEWKKWDVRDGIFDVNCKTFKLFIADMEDAFAEPVKITSKGWRK